MDKRLVSHAFPVYPALIPVNLAYCSPSQVGMAAWLSASWPLQIARVLWDAHEHFQGQVH